MTEIVRYGIINKQGEFTTTCMSEEVARASTFWSTDCTLVKLVGQLPEQKKMKKVATFVYQNGDEVWESGLLRTEDETKAVCKQNGWKLLRWPNCDVLEVEAT
jgi:hypothetical protein